MEWTVTLIASQKARGVSSWTETWTVKFGDNNKSYSTLLLAEHFLCYDLF